MNNTKTIFKSLLIMIVAISLFTVSCSKDEGGTKTPTTPTIQKITDADLTSTLKGLGALGDTSATDIDFSKMTDPAKGKVSGATVDAKVTTATFPAIDSTTEIAVTITITPNTGNSFAAENDLKPYTKDASKNTVTVTLTLKPESTKKWNGVN